jgi:hypothetical protein
MPIHLPFVAPLNGASSYQAAVDGLRVGQRLVVRHEPSNPHDPNACVVTGADGTVCGYLPRAVAGRLVAGHGVGATFDAVVETHFPAGPGRHAGARIKVTGPAATAAAGATVFARSGRVLGTVVAVTDDRVVVRSAGGGDVPYSRGGVTFDAPSTPSTL